MKMATCLDSLERVSLQTFFSILVAIRLLYVLLIGAVFEVNPFDDFYDDLALSLLGGHGFRVAPDAAPDLVRYPLYPLLVASCFAVFGKSMAGLAAFQLALDAITLFVSYQLGRCCLGDRVARVAVVLQALYPFSALYILRCLPEVFFTLLVTTALLLLVKAQNKPCSRKLAAAGLVLGAAVLCKAVALYFVFLTPLLGLLRPSKVEGVARYLLIPLVALLTLMPYAIRNYRVTGTPSLLGTAGGYSLYIGNNLETDGLDRDEIGEEHRATFNRRMLAASHGYSPVSVEAQPILKAAVMHQFETKPVESAWLIARKATRFWTSIYLPGNRSFQIVVFATQLACLALALLGAWGAWQRQAPIHPLLLCIIYFNGIHALVIATFRYCLPIMPAVLLFAACAICSALDRNRHAQRTTET